MGNQQTNKTKVNTKAEGPRERILNTAKHLFYCQGYNSTGINQILKEANVAKASLYQHFGSKDELGVVYLQSAREEMFQELDQWTGGKKDPAEKLLACFDYLESALVEHEFRGCKFINMLAEIADSNPLMRKEIIEHKTKLRAYMKSFVKEAMADKKEAEAIGDTVYLLFEGAIVESKIYRDIWPVKAARDMAKQLLKNQA